MLKVDSRTSTSSTQRFLDDRREAADSSWLALLASTTIERDGEVEYSPFNRNACARLPGSLNVSSNLRVVVFESANPDFYLAHFDLTGKMGNITTAVGPSGLPILMDTFVRLTKSPVVSIAKIRGCVRA